MPHNLGIEQETTTHDQLLVDATQYRARGWRYSGLCLLLLACIIYLLHVADYNYISDDTFITLRYARNLTDGHGLVFNPGERVEGYTSPLWVSVLAGTRLLGADLLGAARSIGVLAGLLTLLMTHRLFLSMGQDRDSDFWAGAAPLIVACNGSFACWAASGMETVPYICLLLGSALFVFSKRRYLSIIFSCGLVLIRPEGILAVALLGLFQGYEVAKGKSSLKKLLPWFVAVFLAVAGLFLFRLLYFGEWLPNTYYAKAGGGAEQTRRGLEYLLDYSADHEGLVLMVVPVCLALLFGNIKQKFIALMVVCFWEATVIEGGDGLPMYRFALGPLPLLAIMQMQMIESVQNAFKPKIVSMKKYKLLAATAIVALAYVNASQPRTGVHYRLYKYQKNTEIPRWTAVGKWLGANAEADESLAAVPIGAVSYYSGLITYDMAGLTDKHIARLQPEGLGKGWAGHEKHDGQYILSKRPTYLLLGNIDMTAKPRSTGNKPFIPFNNQAIYEREKDFYDSTLIYELYRPRSVEIEPGKFFNFYQLKEFKEN